MTVCVHVCMCLYVCECVYIIILCVCVCVWAHVHMHVCALMVVCVHVLAFYQMSGNTLIKPNRKQVNIQNKYRYEFVYHSPIMVSNTV